MGTIEMRRGLPRSRGQTKADCLCRSTKIRTSRRLVMSVGPPMPHQNRCGPCQWVHLQRSARLEHSDSPPLVIVECSQHGPCHSRGAKKRGDRLEAMDMNTEHGSDRSVAGAVPAAHPKVGSSCQA